MRKLQQLPHTFRLDNFSLIQPKQAAKILEVSLRKLYRLSIKDIPHYRIGGQYRYHIKDLMDFKNKK